MIQLKEIMYYSNKINNFMDYVSKHNSHVCLFGGGQAARWYMKFMQENAILVSCIIDGTFKEHEEREYMGIKVCSLEYALKQYKDIVFVISAPAHEDSIREQILKKGLKFPIFTFDPTLVVLQEKSAIEQQKYMIEHWNEYEEVYDKLADEWSKRTLEAILKGRMTSSNEYYADIVSKPQYFPQIIKDNLRVDEVFVDVGAFIGDSIEEFLDANGGNYKKIYAFEPDGNNVSVLRSKYADDRLYVFTKGVGLKNAVVYWNNENGEKADEGAHVTKNEQDATDKIEIVSLDSVIKEKITYLKMDIEGMESEAIAGASELIRRYHPKLAISVYHKQVDIIEISKQILDLDNSYKLYLRHYWESCGTDSILFAI